MTGEYTIQIMARVAPVVPSESDRLCEKCGYVLNGLPATSNCPECGRPIAESTDEAKRLVTAWDRNGPAGLMRTTRQVLFQPTQFYRSLQTRVPQPTAHSFARFHWIVVSVLLGVAVFIHANWFFSDILNQRQLNPALTLILACLIYAGLSFTTNLAARLTAWEAAYRGLRIPRSVALRVLHFHSAHYLPVTLLALATVLGNRIGLDNRWFTLVQSEIIYRFILAAEVILGAAYLFNTYWIGMRNIMYANR